MLLIICLLAIGYLIIIRTIFLDRKEFKHHQNQITLNTVRFTTLTKE